MKVKIVCVATESNSFLEDWKESARIWGFDFDIIGLNYTWTGFEIKMQLVKTYLKGVHRDTIIAVVDAYDLLLCGPPSELIEKYMRLTGGKSLAVGGESVYFLNTHNHNQFVNNSKYRFLNGGFVMGKPEQLEDAYTYALNETPYDDQLGLGRYFDQFPSKVTVDGNQELVANTSTVHEIELVSEGRLKHTETHSTPVVIHFPFMYKDLGKRSETFRTHILDHYVPKHTGFYVKGFLKHILKHGYYNPLYKPLVWGAIVSIILIIVAWYLIKRKRKATTISDSSEIGFADSSEIGFAD